jgi:hypothetical protein
VLVDRVPKTTAVQLISITQLRESSGTLHQAINKVDDNGVSINQRELGWPSDDKFTIDCSKDG